MQSDFTARFRPVAPPRILEGAYSEDQHRRLLGVVRDHGPWPLILAHHFRSPEEVLATTSGDVPEGVTLSWDMFLSPVFRGYLARGSVCLYREIEDCVYNLRFLDLVREYWGARYAEPESMLFNLQGPCREGGAPHTDGTRFRGMTMENTPTWLLLIMCKSGLFRRWQAKKAQVIAWYYRGRIGGGFNCWPDGPHGKPLQIPAPMWGRAVVVENEMMYHCAQSNGPAALRRPEGLGIDALISPDPEREDGWQITSGGRVIQRIPAEETRLLVHWGAQVYLDDHELGVSKDHSDDITLERALEILVADLRARGESFRLPSDPLADKPFIRMLNRVYDPGTPSIRPPEPEEVARVA
jgi:hypothetical protein